MINLSRALLFILFCLGTAGIFPANLIFAAEKIDINTAPIEDLIKIIHIGETRAAELISLRPFFSLDELTKIKGIGKERLKDIKEQGLAWVASESQPQPQLEPEPTLQKESQTETGPLTSPLSYPDGIIFSEILPSPEGADETEEWIETFNQNNFEVLLSGWKITDTTGKITTYTFPEETKISSGGFLVLSRPTTKITLNNDGDGLKLIRPDGKIVSEIAYEKAPLGQSYNFINSSWSWSSNLTPGAENFSPFLQPEEKMGAESLKDSLSQPEEKRKLAAIGEQISKPSNPLFILLIALPLAFFSGAIILFLKKRLKAQI